MTEKELLAAVKDIATRTGWLFYHTFSSRRSVPGYPDVTMVRGRRLIFAELKSDKGKTTDAQDEWLVALGGAAEAYVWRPSDLDDIGTILSPRYAHQAPHE